MTQHSRCHPVPCEFGVQRQAGLQQCTRAQHAKGSPGAEPHKAQALRAGTKNSSGAFSRRNSCQLPSFLPSVLPSFPSEPSANDAAPKLKSSLHNREIHPEKLRPKYLTVSCLLYTITGEWLVRKTLSTEPWSEPKTCRSSQSQPGAMAQPSSPR